MPSNKNVDICTNIFYEKITKLLDEMAPLKKPTKKEVRLRQSPWITHGLLKSMKIRDKLYKEYILEANCVKKYEIQSKYKKY